MKQVAAKVIRRFRPWAVLLVVVLVVGGLGCREERPAPTDANTAAPSRAQGADTPVDVPEQPAQPEPQPDKVAAVVNGTSIMESQIEQRIDAQWKPELAKLADQPPELAAQRKKVLRQAVLNDLIMEQLLDDEARRANITVTEEELTAEMSQRLASRNPPITIEGYKMMVEAQGGDFAAVRELHARSMKYSKLIEAKLGDSLKVSDEEVSKYYEANPREFQVPEQVRASHILVSTEPADPNADPNETRTQARQKAENLLKQVREGADFAALAREHSSCPSAADGGDLDSFTRGRMVKPFEDAAFALKPGETSEIVETKFGYHIIRVTEHNESSQIPFEDVREDITRMLTQRKRPEVIRKYFQTLQSNATISYPASEAPAVDLPAAPVPAPADGNQK